MLTQRNVILKIIFERIRTVFMFNVKKKKTNQKLRKKKLILWGGTGKGNGMFSCFIGAYFHNNLYNYFLSIYHAVQISYV